MDNQSPFKQLKNLLGNQQAPADSGKPEKDSKPQDNVLDFQAFQAAIARERAIDHQRLSAERAKNRQKRLEQELSGAGIPKRFKNATTAILGDFCLDLVLGYCLSAKDSLETGAGVFLYGRTGAGKTTTGCAILNYLGHKGFSVGYRTAFGLVASYHAAGFEGRPKFIDDCAAPDFLFIDEIDKVAGSKIDLPAIMEIIDARSRECRPTIVALNASLSAIESILGHATVDRLTGHGALMIEFTGESYR